ncbi:unnamed protein product, partial [Phaeothamnion confervicola]
MCHAWRVLLLILDGGSPLACVHDADAASGDGDSHRHRNQAVTAGSSSGAGGDRTGGGSGGGGARGDVVGDISNTNLGGAAGTAEATWWAAGSSVGDATSGTDREGGGDLSAPESWVLLEEDRRPQEGPEKQPGEGGQQLLPSSLALQSEAGTGTGGGGGGSVIAGNGEDGGDSKEGDGCAAAATADPQGAVPLAWLWKGVVADLLQDLANVGDVQHAVAICEVLCDWRKRRSDIGDPADPWTPDPAAWAGASSGNGGSSAAVASAAAAAAAGGSPDADEERTRRRWLALGLEPGLVREWYVTYVD